MSLEKLREITAHCEWKLFAVSITSDQSKFKDLLYDFETHWIEAGHHIREQINNDNLLCKLLRQTLPKYDGKDIALFRGENLARWKAGFVGFAWTDQIEVARMFGRGLNARDSGGVLLKAMFKQSAIISGPNMHSQYLGENQFTIDPVFARKAEQLEFFPPL